VLLVAFTGALLSGGEDQASFTGTAGIDPTTGVPAPATGLLLRVGLGLALRRQERREKKSAEELEAPTPRR
jgi:hypothetical protein